MHTPPSKKLAGRLGKRRDAGTKSVSTSPASRNWVTGTAAVVALFASAAALYKSVFYDPELARVELASKTLELTTAEDATLAYGFGEASVVAIQPLDAPGSKGRRHSRHGQQKMLVVSVPVTLKNLSKHPIAIDFNEQWSFLGRLAGPGEGEFAEVLNSSNDAYPIAWRRHQCVIGISGDAWSNLEFGNFVVSEARTAAMAAHGSQVWKDLGLVYGQLPLFKPDTTWLDAHPKEAQLQADQLRRILDKKPYFAHSDVGETCTPVNGGVFAATLRPGEEKTLKATYIVRGEQQWFTHLLRLHYRQLRNDAGGTAWYCRYRFSAALAGWVNPAACRPVPLPGYVYQDLRQTLFLRPSADPKRN
jgi:hypothetical protein